jgi:hypothetical protein
MTNTNGGLTCLASGGLPDKKTYKVYCPPSVATYSACKHTGNLQSREPPKVGPSYSRHLPYYVLQSPTAISSSTTMATLRKSVTFTSQPEIRPIEPRPHSRRSKLNMAKKLTEELDRNEVADEVLEQASKLFSENYGVWSEQAAERMGKYAKAGRYACTAIYTI